jgi:DNA polymerase
VKTNQLKVKSFENLILKVKYCKACERMCHRKKVLSKNNGNIHSKVLFIAEAPGRLGAEQTNTPLYGDKTGDNFEMFLQSIGWKREDIFITNAILCNPQNINGNNTIPTNNEIVNCNGYLKATLEVVNPDLIVTLGRTALLALKKIHFHSFELKDSVAKKQSWNNKYLFPMYHPSPKSINLNRNLVKQLADYKKLSSIIDPINGLKKVGCI